jgi:hypothetical protein
MSDERVSETPKEAGASSASRHRSQPDYIDRTIETVRNHRDADNCWPSWANIFADEIEDLRADLAKATSTASPENPGAPENTSPSGDAAIVREAIYAWLNDEKPEGRGGAALAALARIEAERDEARKRVWPESEAVEYWQGRTLDHAEALDAERIKLHEARAALAEATTALRQIALLISNAHSSTRTRQAQDVARAALDALSRRQP